MNRKMTTGANFNKGLTECGGESRSGRTVRLGGRLLMMAAAVVCALSLGLGLQTVPGYTAGENYTLNVQYTAWGEFSPSDLKATSPTQLTLYRVGDCTKAGSSWDISLVPGLDNITLTKDEIAALNSEEKSESERIEAWLQKAATIDAVIQSNPGLQKELLAGTTSSNPQSFSGNGTATFAGLDRGLYLIHGGGQWAESTDKYWSPQPMLVQVIAQNNQANLKPVAQEPVDEITVVKAWSGDKENKRPASIEVALAYDGDPVKTVTLDKENNWTAKYKTEAGQKDPSKWSAAEVTVLTDYTPSIVRSNVVNKQITITMTNTYEPQSYELELVKKLPVFVDHGKLVSTAFAFELTGYQGSNAVYHRYAGLAFDAAGEQSTTVTGIPKGLTRLVVKEIDSAGYKTKGSAEKEAVLDGKVYKVEFENEYDDIRYGGGVINKYKVSDGKIKFDLRKGIVRE